VRGGGHREQSYSPSKFVLMHPVVLYVYPLNTLGFPPGIQSAVSVGRRWSAELFTNAFVGGARCHFAIAVAAGAAVLRGVIVRVQWLCNDGTGRGERSRLMDEREARRPSATPTLRISKKGTNTYSNTPISTSLIHIAPGVSTQKVSKLSVIVRG
jgi:hypothetical protein